MPVSAISFGVAGSLEAIRRVAVLFPVDVGVKVTETVQLPARAMVGVAPQVPTVPSPLVSVNMPLSLPVTAMAETNRLALPLLLSVKVCAVELLLVVILPKSLLPGERLKEANAPDCPPRTGQT